LCGQAPSDHPEFAGFLVECGIDSMSVSPDSFIAVKRRVAAAEKTAQSVPTI
jgi:pyruvate,water dikinase